MTAAAHGAQDDCRLPVPRSTFVHAQRSLEAEWLVTNGIGGYASSTVGHLHTRRYHGLLVAALEPPLGRTVMVAKVDACVRVGGEAHDLCGNEYADGTLTEGGCRWLQDFHLDQSLPVWLWRIGGTLLELRVWMAHGRNTTYLQYSLLEGDGHIELELRPLCTYRDYHWQLRGDAARTPQVLASPDGCSLRVPGAAQAYSLRTTRGSFHGAGDWYWNFRHRAEAERGLDSEEDLYCPGRFVATLKPGEHMTLVLDAGLKVPPLAAEAVQAQERSRRTRVLHALPGNAPEWIRQLTLAADQFLVARASADRPGGGTTVIAGYPWFGDWGRDTMIAMPGLTLATGRLQDAASILRTFASHVDRGMLPNRFVDDGGQAEYNTVDATLWYFHAIGEYLGHGGDSALLRELYPVLADIIDWHLRGTRHGIQVDPADGLLRAGEPGVQLTWMDARVGDRVITPRIGKPVEINALWCHALLRMVHWSAQLKDGAGHARYTAAANRCRAAFEPAFWDPECGYLRDVVDGPEGVTLPDGRRVDRSLRPNQLFAVSLGDALLSTAHELAVVSACARALLTPVGLRSLAPSHPDYVGRYAGPPHERDACYHQGTVWSWLLGPYALAHFRVHDDAAAAQRLLVGLEPHLAECGLGTISEIFNGNAPHEPAGCIAQAWSVGETLRAWHRLEQARQTQRPARMNHG